MRISFLLATRNFGGAQRSSLEMAGRLAENHEVLIVEVERTDEAYTLAIAQFGLTLKKFEGKIGWKGPLRKAVSWYVWSKWLKGVYNEWQPDVVIVKDTKTLSLLNTKSAYKIFFHARAWYASYQVSRFKRYVFKRVKPHFLAVSQATRHALFNAGLAQLEKISVVPNALNLPLHFERKATEESHIRLMHAGGFISTKGHHITLEVAARLRAAGVPFHLTLVGFIYDAIASAQYFRCLQDYIKKYNLQANVTIITDKSNLDDLYLENDILMYPSGTEGLPRVVMEAMHYKLAVIANPVGGVIDLINDGITGYIADHNNIKAFAARVEELHNDPELRVRLGERASELIRQGYTVENQMSKINHIFAQ